MSIIHQALKKIEGIKHGPGPDHAAHAGPGGERRSLKIVLPMLLVIVLALVVLALYSGSLDVGLLIKEKGGEKGSEAVVVAGGAGTSEADSPAGVKSASTEAKEKQTPPMTAAERNAKGVELFRTGLYREAAEEFTGAVELEPGMSVYHNNLALAYAGLDDTRAAKEHLKEALKLRPEYPEALNNLGALLARDGKDREAVKMFTKALSHYSDMPDAHLNLAAILEKRGEYREAMEHYEEYIRLTGPVTGGGGGGGRGRVKDLKEKMLRIKAMLLSGHGEEKTELRK
jgi:tetratricopeptide (TPR) repeat protein